MAPAGRVAVWVSMEPSTFTLLMAATPFVVAFGLKASQYDRLRGAESGKCEKKPAANRIHETLRYLAAADRVADMEAAMHPKRDSFARRRERLLHLQPSKRSKPA